MDIKDSFICVVKNKNIEPFVTSLASTRAGYANIPPGALGKVRVQFNPSMATRPIVTANAFQVPMPTFMVSITISEVDATGFTLNCIMKDGRSGQSGGGYYTGWVGWTAVEPTQQNQN